MENIVNIASPELSSLWLTPRMSMIKASGDAPLFNIMEEQWKDIPEYEGYYQISNLGRVKSCDRFTFDRGRRMNIIQYGRVLKPGNGTGGYLNFNIHKNYIQKTYRVHRCVAIAFVLNPKNKPDVNHIDGVKTNNIATNLEWVTRSENELHAYKYLGKKGAWCGRFGKSHTRSKPIDQYTIIGDFIKQWGSQADIERTLGFSQGNISACCTGKQKTSYGYKWEFAKDSLYGT